MLDRVLNVRTKRDFKSAHKAYQTRGLQTRTTGMTDEKKAAHNEAQERYKMSELQQAVQAIPR
jgi:hypothetical protein